MMRKTETKLTKANTSIKPIEHEPMCLIDVPVGRFFRFERGKKPCIMLSNHNATFGEEGTLVTFKYCTHDSFHTVITKKVTFEEAKRRRVVPLVILSLECGE